jgi:hypothetical protein
MFERRRVRDGERDVVDVAEPPVLSRLIGLDERMLVRMEVSGGVAVGGVVATPDVAAGHAHP